MSVTIANKAFAVGDNASALSNPPTGSLGASRTNSFGDIYQTQLSTFPKSGTVEKAPKDLSVAPQPVESDAVPMKTVAIKPGKSAQFTGTSSAMPAQVSSVNQTSTASIIPLSTLTRVQIQASSSQETLNAESRSLEPQTSIPGSSPPQNIPENTASIPVSGPQAGTGNHSPVAGPTLRATLPQGMPAQPSARFSSAKTPIPAVEMFPYPKMRAPDPSTATPELKDLTSSPENSVPQGEMSIALTNQDPEIGVPASLPVANVPSHGILISASSPDFLKVDATLAVPETNVASNQAAEHLPQGQSSAAIFQVATAANTHQQAGLDGKAFFDPAIISKSAGSTGSKSAPATVGPTQESASVPDSSKNDVSRNGDDSSGTVSTESVSDTLAAEVVLSFIADSSVSAEILIRPAATAVDPSIANAAASNTNFATAYPKFSSPTNTVPLPANQQETSEKNVTAASQSVTSDGTTSHKDANDNSATTVLAPLPVANGSPAASTQAAITPNTAVPSVLPAKSNLKETSSSPDPSTANYSEPPAQTVASNSPVQLAQIVNQAAQSEMRIGLSTASFGNVEVRTVVHATDVGVLIGSEKGDLRSLLANDLPAISNTLQQQNLRLTQVSFQQQGFAFSSGSSSGGNSQPRSFTAKPSSTPGPFAELSSTESGEASEPRSSSRFGSFSILA